MVISEVYKLYYNDKKLEGYSPKTLKGYKYQVGLLIRNLGDTDIQTISISLIKEYLLQQTHLQKSSLGMRIRFLKSFFRYCYEERYVNINISKKLKEPKLGKRIPKYLTEEEIIILEEACISELEKSLILVIFATGCRVGEIYNINKYDIDWDRRALKIIGKGDCEREVYFNVKSSYWLKRYLTKRKDNDDALFVTERKPHRMSIAQIEYVVKRIKKRSGLNIRVYPHRFRYSHAQRLLDAGMPIEEIRQNLGHARTDTTLGYLHFSGEHRRESYNKYFR